MKLLHRIVILAIIAGIGWVVLCSNPAASVDPGSRAEAALPRTAHQVQPDQADSAAAPALAPQGEPDSSDAVAVAEQSARAAEALADVAYQADGRAVSLGEVRQELGQLVTSLMETKRALLALRLQGDGEEAVNVSQ